MRVTGIVKWFNDAKGFGFIGPAGGGEDVFVHFGGIAGKGHRSLDDGDEVEFEIGNDEKGRTCATGVTKLKSAVRV